MDSKNRQQHEGSSEITFKVSIKNWPKYYVISLTEVDSDEQVDISMQAVSVFEINRLFAAVVANIQETDMYEIVGALSGAAGSFERSILFKIKEDLDWEYFLRDDLNDDNVKGSDNEDH